MAVSVDDFGKALVASGLITAEEVKTLLGAIPADALPKHGDALAELLVDAGKLTPFQAEELLSGRDTPLVLGDYVLMDKIGAGGMGQVFKAQHRRLKRLAAVKLLSTAVMKDAAAIRRFQREVEAAGGLSHPNIVQAYDAGEVGGRHYLAMEYVEGRNLWTLLKERGPLPIHEAVDLTVQVARGLAYAHGKGIIHRDIKPANLLLDREGVVKILDMGLARIDQKSDDAEQQLTQPGTVMGTVDYIAPEQATSTHEVDRRADIYSLGCTFYRLVTGECIYPGDSTVKKLYAHHNGPIPSILDKRPEIAPEIDRIFRKMVAKKPEDRHQQASEVIKDLENWLDPGETSDFSGLASRAQADRPAVQVRRSVVRPGDTTKTNSKTEIDAPRVAEPRRTPKPSARILVAGAAAVGLLLLAVFAVTRDRSVGDVGNFLTGSVATGVPAVPPKATAPFDAATARKHQEAWAKHLGTPVATVNSVGATMVLIPPGEFLMGSTDAEVAAALKAAEELNVDPTIRDRIQKVERPQHRVVLTKPLRMGTTEVTIGQFKKFAAAAGYRTEAENAAETKTYLNPGYIVTDDLPAACLTWNDAAAFCEWLTKQETLAPGDSRAAAYAGGGGRVADGTPPAYATSSLSPGAKYRLPTEAEWEFACRAGTTTQYSFGDDGALLDQYGWYDKNAGGNVHRAGTKLPNGFGLFDMHGNLSEWCRDYYTEDWYAHSPSDDPTGPVSLKKLDHVVRGSGINYSATQCRSAFRSYRPLSEYGNCGFRCVRELDVPATTAGYKSQ